MEAKAETLSTIKLFMSEINKPITKRTKDGLPANFGCDRGKKLVVSFDVGDVLKIRVSGRKTVEIFSLFDLYGMAIRNRVRRESADKEAKRREKRMSKVLKKK